MKKIYLLTDEENEIVGVVSDQLYKTSEELIDEIGRLDEADLMLYVDVDAYRLYDSVEPIMSRLKANALRFSELDLE
jgi:hypothetical protein